MDIYNDEYSFVEKFKTISMNWVNNEYSNYKGRLYFEEINKFIEYDLPKTKDKNQNYNYVEMIMYDEWTMYISKQYINISLIMIAYF